MNHSPSWMRSFLEVLYMGGMYFLLRAYAGINTYVAFLIALTTLMLIKFIYTRFINVK